MRILKMGRGTKPEYLEKTPFNQSKNQYYISEVKIFCPSWMCASILVYMFL